MKRIAALLCALALMGAACSRPEEQPFPIKEEPTHQLSQAMEDYAARTAGQVITPGSGENICYSPLSLYVAVGLAA